MIAPLHVFPPHFGFWILVQVKEDYSNEKNEDLPLDSCHDIAIVGAGPGGAFTAWRLRKKGLNIAIYEQLNRVGGRAFSIKIPGMFFFHFTWSGTTFDQSAKN